MIRRPPRSTLSSSSAASDVYKRQRLADRSVADALSEAKPQLVVRIGRLSDTSKGAAAITTAGLSGHLRQICCRPWGWVAVRVVAWAVAGGLRVTFISDLRRGVRGPGQGRTPARQR